MTAVEWFAKQVLRSRQLGFISNEKFNELLEQAKEMEKQHKILLVEQLKNYTKEAQCILGNDEREASEFVEIFSKINFKSE